MKEKIRLALINKYKNLGYSDKAIEGLLAYLETIITDENQIETGVNGVEGMLKAFQSEIDSRVSTAVAKAKGEGPKKEGDPKKEEPVLVPDDAPAWAKALIQQNQTLMGKVTALETGTSANTRKQALEAKLKDVSQAVKDSVLKDFDRLNFKDEEDFTTWLGGKETDIAALEQTVANTGLGQQNKPFQPSTIAPKQVDADIAGWASQGKPAGTVTAAKV